MPPTTPIPSDGREMSHAAEVWATVSYQPLLREFFAGFVRFLVRRHFSRLTLVGPVPYLDPGLPWIFVANHISWWDGFFLWSLQRKLAPQRRIYTVMLAREYVKLRWFRWIGGLPLEPSSSASLRYLLRFVKDLGQNPQKPWILSFFPQGEIRPMATRPLLMRRGWQGLIKRDPQALVIPVALHIEPGNERRPQVWIKIGSPLENHTTGETDPVQADPVQADTNLGSRLEHLLHEINLEISKAPTHQESGKESSFAHTCLL